MEFVSYPRSIKIEAGTAAVVVITRAAASILLYATLGPEWSSPSSLVTSVWSAFGGVCIASYIGSYVEAWLDRRWSYGTQPWLALGAQLGCECTWLSVIMVVGVIISSVRWVWPRPAYSIVRARRRQPLTVHLPAVVCNIVLEYEQPCALFANVLSDANVLIMDNETMLMCLAGGTFRSHTFSGRAEEHTPWSLMLNRRIYEWGRSGIGCGLMESSGAGWAKFVGMRTSNGDWTPPSVPFAHLAVLWDDHMFHVNPVDLEAIPANEVVSVCTPGFWDFAVLKRRGDMFSVAVGYTRVNTVITKHTTPLPGNRVFVSVALSSTFVYALTSTGELFQISRAFDRWWTSSPALGPVRKIISIFDYEMTAHAARTLVCLALLVNGDLIRLGQEDVLGRGVDDVFSGNRSCVTADYKRSAFNVVTL